MKLLTTKQVAERLGVDVRTVHRMADAGRLPYVTKLDGATGAYVYDPDAIDTIAQQRALSRFAARQEANA